MDLYGDVPQLKSISKTPTAARSRGTLLMANLYSDLDGPQSPSTSGPSLYDNAPEPSESSSDKDNGGAVKRKSDSDVDVGVTVKKHKLAKFSMHGYFAERKGEREEMQDMHVIEDDFASRFTKLNDCVHSLSLFAVFDGHGGAKASKYAANYLPFNLRSYFPNGDMDHIQKNMKRCFIDAFKKTDDDFLREASKRKPSWKDGTTAVCVLAINDVAYIGNLGDSKAVLCRHSNGKYVAVPLTVDHSPSVYDERVRIQKAGAQVVEGRVMGVLEVSRSIGDGQYKNHGVISTPEIKRCQLTENDRFIILACDGLWKTFTSQESVDLVNKTIDEHGDDVPLAEKYEAACNRLVSRSVLRLSADNVTVVIIALVKNDASNSVTLKNDAWNS